MRIILALIPDIFVGLFLASPAILLVHIDRILTRQKMSGGGESPREVCTHCGQPIGSTFNRGTRS